MLIKYLVVFSKLKGGQTSTVDSNSLFMCITTGLMTINFINTLIVMSND